MQSEEFRLQRSRIERLATQECPEYKVVFQEQDDLDKIRFGLEHRTTGKCSGRSVARSPKEVKEKEDARWKKILRLMVEQCARQSLPADPAAP